MAMQLSDRISAFEDTVRANASRLAPVLPISLCQQGIAKLDFSAANRELSNIELGDTKALENYVAAQLQRSGAAIGSGGYAEQRLWYQRSALFDSPEGPRTLHLGVDIWAPPETPVSAPLDGYIHSFKDNAHFGDYGPTIILEHELDGISFFTIYGHLSRSSLLGKSLSQPIKSGERFATIGNTTENGSWPAHLHFQITFDMIDNFGDFPGVSAEANSEFYLSICPDPNLLLSPMLAK